MACKRCEDLNQVFRIRHPRDLDQAIRVILDNLDDGTIVEDPSVERVGARFEASPETLGAFAEAEAWPDHVEYYFRCASCGQSFRLECERYHGSGGEWAPREDEEP